MGTETDRAVHSGEMYDSEKNVFNVCNDVRDNAFNIARGLSPGAQPFSAAGERTTIGAEAEHPLWSDGPVVNVPAPTGVQVSVVSTSINDTAAGTNIQEIEIHYLDVNLDPQIEIIELNGTTPVLSVATDVRFIQDFHATRTGVNQGAAGTITVSNSGDIYSTITIGQVRAASTFRMVPKGKILYFDGAAASAISGTASATALMRIVATELEGQQFLDPYIFIPQGSIGVQDNAISMAFPIPFGFKEGTIVGAIHTVDKACTTSMTWFGRLEPATRRGNF